MSDKMLPIAFNNLLKWIFTEYKNHQTIFGIPKEKFFITDNSSKINILDDKISNPIGPAAGPHTQLAQNIISAYLTGARFFELKTVQKMDELVIDKPCIDAHDECYNVEWSQELKLDQSYNEYLKAWMILHILPNLIGEQSILKRDFIFNMSVGYDLEGIKTPRMDQFINELKDASNNADFIKYKYDIINFFNAHNIPPLKFDESEIDIDIDLDTNEGLNSFPYNISNSVTLSTMHGCPPNEIEAITKYLIEDKGLHTYVKLNPTLLGYETVKGSLSQLGFDHIQLKEESFAHDLQYKDAVPMLHRLTEFAQKHNKIFGVKLSNTLGVSNTQNKLAGAEMYMSGRSLFPLTINLAYKLALEFEGDLNISYSGGANAYNTNAILETGIRPITYATDLLKPGGYQRLYQISSQIRDKNILQKFSEPGINISLLKSLAEKSLTDNFYQKEHREIGSIKVQKELGMFDCFISPCQEACPIHQDVSEYIRLVGEERYVEAFELIVSKNALPHITGYICDHQCQYHCTRWDYDDPVMIREIKKKAALEGYDEYIKNFLAKYQYNSNGTKACIIGAGPSGLATAYFLLKVGFDVTLLEHAMKPGGIVQNVLPDFRLPQSAIEADIKFIEKLGARFVFGVDYNFSIDKLKEEGFKYIYIATGAGKSNKMSLPGNTDNIYDAIDFLRDFKEAKNLRVGKNVAIIGGGNSAMDSARAAKRCVGVKNVYIIYRRTKEFMPADKEEFKAAINDGVEFKNLLSPVKFEQGILTCQKMKLDKVGEDGRRNVVVIENEFIDLKIDTIISAIGEKVDTDILQENKIELHNNSVKVIEDSNETSVSDVYIGGDALRGPSTVVESIADGRKAANSIIARENLDPLPIIKTEQFFDPAKREKDIVERKGFISQQKTIDILAETNRCLDCNFLCTKCVEVCPNRANIAIDVSSSNGLFTDKYQILHFDSACNECGNCETFCPHNGAPYKDKLTLFRNKIEFDNSSNDGFYFDQKNNICAKIRIGSISGELNFGMSGEYLSDSLDDKITKDETTKLSSFISEIIENYNYLIEEPAE